MAGLFRGLGWILVALGWFALGADAYWCWKAQAWTFQPISFYLDLANPLWAAGVRIWSFGAGGNWPRLINSAFGWPVWAPCFVLGYLLLGLLRRR